ncbi:hypothetical protein PARHAE_00337 [Paracoccus haematequi]|uniref:Uncharacterized protein n=1 Tax=Paracoccus haematequi TaxID=2491866 RepID=A0A447II25_9RHOB|nr:hypothetical protein PARHAE_00337 [Paracoccus haematequi]
MRIDLPVKPALLSYCRKLVAEGAEPSEVVHVYRGRTLCFLPVPLATFAKLATEERSDRSIRFVRHRETLPQSDEYASATATAEGCGHE